jgi:hypothetical protein
VSGPWRAQISPGNANGRSSAAFIATNPYTGTLTRGKMITLDDEPRKTFHFLVNPSIITTSYGDSSIDVTDTSPGGSFMTEGVAAALDDGLLGLSFEILLDRTYEVYQRKSGYEAGVLHDIRALERVVGLSGGGAGATRSGVSSDLFGASIVGSLIQSSVEETLSGVLVKKFIRFLFGSARSFSFDGYVSSMSVVYTHFSRTMVPMRAGVSIQASSIGNMGPQEGPMGGSVWSDPNADGIGTVGANTRIPGSFQ